MKKGSVYFKIVVFLVLSLGFYSLAAGAEGSAMGENADIGVSPGVSDQQKVPEPRAEVGKLEIERDPFRPFIKMITEDEEVETGSLTPPIKRYDLQEFRIAGVLWLEGEPRAMVVDPDNNTYYLAVGDEIGNKGGVILEIRNSGMLVKETRQYEDLFGEKKVEVKNVVLSFVE